MCTDRMPDDIKGVDVVEVETNDMGTLDFLGASIPSHAGRTGAAV